MTGVIVVEPLAITESMIVLCDVPETDYAAYSAGTTYALSARVIVVSTHAVYESLQAGNVGHDPTELGSAWWIKVSATNRYKSLDTSSTTQAVRTGSMSYRITPGCVVNAVAILNAYADSARIRMVDPIAGTVYDRTISLLGVVGSSSWSAWYFSRRRRKSQAIALDLPNYYGADILIDLVAASGDVRMGILVMGYQRELGRGVQFGVRVGIDDYSKRKKPVRRCEFRRAGVLAPLEPDDERAARPG